MTPTETYTAVKAMHDKIKDLESRVKRMKTRADHWRAIAVAQGKEITRLKKGKP